MTKYIYTIIVLGCMAMFGQLNAQTASVQTGCIPLNVQFTAPSSSDYFWDFDDGASSSLQNPEHVFTNAGDYTIGLYASQGGALIGEIFITVYPDIIVEIDADETMGCLPMEVNFTPTVIKDDEIDIISYLWTFGDGGSSSEITPSYIYEDAGVYDVSLKVTTSIGECDKVQIFSDYITVTGVPAKFVSNKFSSCESTDVFTFTNQTEDVPGNSYSWDFGNGETFEGYQPGPITFEGDGVYRIVLTVTTEVGCVSTSQRNINLGPPLINFEFEPSACFNSPFFMNNATIADEHIWEIEDNPAIGILDLSASPILVFLQYGEYEISYTAVSFLGCTSDTTFTVKVEELNPKFTVGPEVTCSDEITVILEAEDLTHVNYTWINFNDDGSNFVTTSPIITDEYVAPERDSFFVNYHDSIYYHLEACSPFTIWMCRFI